MVAKWTFIKNFPINSSSPPPPCHRIASCAECLKVISCRFFFFFFLWGIEMASSALLSKKSIIKFLMGFLLEIASTERYDKVVQFIFISCAAVTHDISISLCPLLKSSAGMEFPERGIHAKLSQPDWQFKMLLFLVAKLCPFTRKWRVRNNGQRMDTFALGNVNGNKETRREINEDYFCFRALPVHSIAGLSCLSDKSPPK